MQVALNFIVSKLEVFETLWSEQLGANTPAAAIEYKAWVPVQEYPEA